MRAWIAPRRSGLFAGSYFVTMVFNVPMNDALASLFADPDRTARWTMSIHRPLAQGLYN